MPKSNIPCRMLLCLFMLLPACASESRSETGYGYTEFADVSFVSEGVSIAASLWLPKKSGPHPAIVIAHGSGRAVRHNLYWMAEHFASKGIAVLTYDKRGVGQSGGTYEGRNNASEGNLTLLAKDVAAGVAYLRTRSDIDHKQVGLWGVSQAGWILPIAASLADDIKFTILISGPTVTVGEENHYSKITGDGSITTELTREQISEKLKERGPYGFDPLPYLKRMDMPGLWLLGDADESIPIPETVTILDRLIQNDKRDFSYRVFDHANHGLRVNGRVVEDYWKLQDDFLMEHVKIKIIP